MKRLEHLWILTGLFYIAATQDTPDTQTVRSGSCTFEGVRYDNGEAILVRDAPCVRCTCKLGVPECRVRMCPPLPDPPPRGCIIVHQRDTCCAKLVCTQGPEENATKIRDILEAEQQKQQFLSSNRLRSDEPNDGTCIIGGTRYATGSALSSSSLCRHCFCVRGRERCVSPRCVLAAPGCRPVFRAPACCPVKYDCREQVSNKTETGIAMSSKPGSKITVKNTKSRGCVVSGRRYTDGASIPAAARSPCESCFCLRGAVRCAHSRCAGPLDGCTPIVAPGRCCPISYDCAGVSNATSVSKATDPKKGGAIWDNNQIRSLGGPPLIPTDSRSHREVSSTAFSTAQTPPTSPQIVTTVKAITASESRNVKTEKNITFLTTRVSAGVLIDGNSSRPSGQATIINQSRKKNEDYDYDYMSLPPSLPNLRIIPFVAADAVTSNDKPKEKRPQVGDIILEGKTPTEGIQTKTEEDPDIRFSPPQATEGGFEPKQPVPEGPFFQSLVPVFTTSINGPVVNSDSAGSNEDGSLRTKKPNTTEKVSANNDTTTTKESIKAVVKKGALCDVNGRPYRHGELVSSPSECELCVCHDGEVQCQPPLCGPAPDGCRRLPRQDSCCGPILCAPTLMMAPNTPAKLSDDLLISEPTIPPPSATTRINRVSSTNTETPAASPSTSTQTPTTQSLTTSSTFSPTMSTITTVATPSSAMTSASTLTTAPHTISSAIPPKLKATLKPSTTEIAEPVGILKVSATTHKPVRSTTPNPTSKRPTTTISFLQALWGDTDNSENEAQDKVDHNYEDSAPQTHPEEEDSDDSFSFDKVFELLFSSGEATTAKPKTTTKLYVIRPSTTTTTTDLQYVTPLTSTPAAPQYVTPLKTTTTSTTKENTPAVVPSTTTSISSTKDVSTQAPLATTTTVPKTTTTLLYVTRLFTTPKTTTVQSVTPTTSIPTKSTTTTVPSTTGTGTYSTSTTQKFVSTQFVTPVSTTPKSATYSKEPTSTPKTRTTKVPVTNAPVPETSSRSYFTSTTRRLFSPTRLTYSNLHRSPPSVATLRQTTPRIYTTTERLTTTLENFIPPPTRASLYGRPFAGSKPVQQSGSLNVLKLAGCNIYGRMYRVGRIIIELSGPCKECSCTEFGVQCRYLVC